MRIVAGLVIALAIGVLAPRDAAAYPQFQFAAGSERCQACHLAPDGGGLLNAFGRSEVGDTISWGGDGELLHGAWTPPDAIAIGGDLRLAGLARHRTEDGPQLAAFPMQADLYLRAAAGPLALHVTGGLNGAARSRPDGAGLETYLVSREHYVMYQREPGAFYVRAGRFAPVLGLRSQDHTQLVRRAIDAYLLDEPYALGGGASGSRWEAHASVFVPSPLRAMSAGPRARGATALFERFFDDASLAGQARLALTDTDRRVLVGAIAKWWLPTPRILLLGELDLQHQAITAASTSRLHVIGYAGANLVMLPGLIVGLAVQRWDPDLVLGGSARSTAELGVQLFPHAHVELHLIGRVGLVGGRLGAPDSLAMMQLHYYL